MSKRRDRYDDGGPAKDASLLDLIATEAMGAIIRKIPLQGRLVDESDVYQRRVARATARGAYTYAEEMIAEKRRRERKHEAVRVDFRFSNPRRRSDAGRSASRNPFPQGERSMIVLHELLNTEECDVFPEFRDIAGNIVPPERIDGAPQWSSTNETYATIHPAPDGLSAVLRTVGPVTPADQPTDILCTADARMGDDVVPVTGVIRLTVRQDTSEEAVDVGFRFGEPRRR